jgi:dTDP-4-amino-4,6-dideoxygalactose transaminase
MQETFLTSMLNSLIPHILALRGRFPRTYQFFVSFGKRYLGKRLGIFPRPMANEIEAVRAVLRSSQWNMCYGSGLAHERLEHSFAEFLGGGYAIAVNTGGMALQMTLRGLGLKPGDEVIHQVDTCSAAAMAVLNAGCTPLFSDISAETFMLRKEGVSSAVGEKTKLLIATHMWGNPEDMKVIAQLRAEHGLFMVEDACLSLGAISDGEPVGAIGDVGTFSFGCLKPIQGGEGGMIFTRNEALARELRSMRHWGDRTLEFGVRDVTQLSWNGRISELVAAVVHEQLKGYPMHLKRLRESVRIFSDFLDGIDGLNLHLGAAKSIDEPAYSQIVVRINEERFGWEKNSLIAELYKRGIQVRHANFEPINSLSFFKDGGWRPWVPSIDHEHIAQNYAGGFPEAQRLLEHTGIGLGNISFLSKQNLKHLMRQIGDLALHRQCPR